MPQNPLPEELDRLTGFLTALQEQDKLLTEAMKLKVREVSIPHVGFIKGIFDQIAAYDSSLVRPFATYADPVTSLAQVRDVIPKIQRRIELLNPQKTSTEQSIQASVNKRCVFVVYGRNDAANKALFQFLRAIDLDPIEWDEAVAMTAHGSPYPGQALEVAFSKAQAAVVLLTGDDMARLGTRFLKDSDKEYERTPTPQCRPNVLFEAGMAFGLHPERTIVVSLGETRPFSDVLGRHIIYLSNTPDCRNQLANRLRNAGCEVKTENRRSWLSEGDFDAAKVAPDLHQVSTAQPAPRTMAGKTTSAEILYGPTRKPPIDGSSFTFDPECKRLTLTWDEGLSLEIVWNSSSIYGFIVSIANDTADYISSFQVEVAEANSWNEKLRTFLPNRSFQRYRVHSGKDLGPMQKTNGQWLIKVLNQNKDARLTLGNDQRSPLLWPNNDPADVEVWRLTMAVSYSQLSSLDGNLTGLPPAHLLVRWDRKEGTLQMTKYDQPQP